MLAALSYGQLKSEVDIDRELIIKMNEHWDKNAMAGNMTANAEQYVKDAVRIGYGTVEVGKKKILKTFKKYDKQLTVTTNENHIKDISISGDLAVAIGDFTGSTTSLLTGETIDEKGTWVDVYQRQSDGTWKSVCTVFSETKE